MNSFPMKHYMCFVPSDGCAINQFCWHFRWEINMQKLPIKSKGNGKMSRIKQDNWQDKIKQTNIKILKFEACSRSRPVPGQKTGPFFGFNEEYFC